MHFTDIEPFLESKSFDVLIAFIASNILCILQLKAIHFWETYNCQIVRLVFSKFFFYFNYSSLLSKKALYWRTLYLKVARKRTWLILWHLGFHQSKDYTPSRNLSPIQTTMFSRFATFLRSELRRVLWDSNSKQNERSVKNGEKVQDFCGNELET